MTGLDEGDNHDTHYLMLDGSTLVCLIDLGEKKCRIVMRDVCGRHCWNTERLFDTLEVPEYTVPLPDFYNIPKQQCVFGEEHPDCLLFFDRSLNEPAPIDPEQEKEICAIMVEIDRLELEGFEQVSSSTREFREQDYKLGIVDPFYNCRILWNAIGHASFNFLCGESVTMLQKSSSLFRDIKGLDKKTSRELFKAAVIYVGPGQTEESQLLNNETGSVDYCEFVRSLGWIIDVGTHDGFLGGLEKNGTNGKQAIYYCTSGLEFLFHDTTIMPLDPSDSKQIKKKRHIGNDDVHIVWNEHYREYDSRTVSGDFGNAKIIITPLSAGLFLINIQQHVKFGPLRDRMIVSKETLGRLVRQTAIDAYRACKETPQDTAATRLAKHPYYQRAQDMKIIQSRHKCEDWTYEQFLETVFNFNNSTTTAT